MLEDAEELQQLGIKYPKRVLGIRYEDLVADPASVARQVYNTLLGLPVPQAVLDGFDRIINAKVVDPSLFYYTVRTNSTETANEWKTTMDPELQKQVTNLCKPLLVRMRYDI